MNSWLFCFNYIYIVALIYLIFILFFGFQPPSPLALPNFKGCIELDTLNEEVLSLYNFENAFQLNTTAEKPYGRSVYKLSSN